MSRFEQRASFDVPTRLRLVEVDLDDFERTLDKIDARLGKIMAACVGILTSLVVVAVGLALNLAAVS